MAALSTIKGFSLKLVEHSLSLFLSNVVDDDTVDSSNVRITFYGFITFLVSYFCFNLTSIYSHLAFR